VLCEALQAASEDVRITTALNDEDHLLVVDSGDVTASGLRGEFAVAHPFMHWLSTGKHAQVSPLQACLAQHPNELLCVPGNHDQWRGSAIWMWGYNPNLAGLHFRRCPCRTLWKSGDLELELFGIDSNAGFGANDFNWEAYGRLDQSTQGQMDCLVAELKRSDEELAQRKGTQTRVRAFVVHHSVSYPWDWRLSFEPASADRLLEVAAEFNVTALLSGHIHDFALKDVRVARFDKNVTELRSASTFQGPARRKPKPGFLAHKIWLDDTKKVHWWTWRYFYSAEYGFAPKSRDVPCIKVL
jgi:hypothetical protein